MNSKSGLYNLIHKNISVPIKLDGFEPRVLGSTDFRAIVGRLQPGCKVRKKMSATYPKFGPLWFSIAEAIYVIVWNELAELYQHWLL